MTQKLLLSISDIARYLGVSRPYAYKLVRTVGFPKPIPIGLDEKGQSLPSRWSVESIDAWRLASVEVAAE
jgi:predicted DNA-binding transcriptional regulator AlpA